MPPDFNRLAGKIEKMIALPGRLCYDMENAKFWSDSMEYIILDMEWNQAWPGSYAAQRPLPIHLSGEIIQIGAVRMDEAQQVLDEFQVLIRPKFSGSCRPAQRAWRRRQRRREAGIPDRTSGGSS